MFIERPKPYTDRPTPVRRPLMKFKMTTVSVALVEKLGGMVGNALLIKLLDHE